MDHLTAGLADVHAPRFAHARAPARGQGATTVSIPYGLGSVNRGR